VSEMSGSSVGVVVPSEEQADDRQLRTGAAAACAGVSERALRYYEQLGLIKPSSWTAGGMRRYSEASLSRVRRIRELQNLLGLNLEEIAVVLRHDDRVAEIRQIYKDERTGTAERRRLAQECLALQENLRATVEAKRASLEVFLADVDARIARIQELLKDCGEPDD
jgi:DNA-binding transcriptional MerR regulator